MEGDQEREGRERESKKREEKTKRKKEGREGMISIISSSLT